MSTAVNPKQEQEAHKFDNLIGEVSKAEADEAHERIIKARVKMLMSHGFFGNLATRLKIADASKWCPTAATDGKYLYYNAKFVNMLSINKLVFLIAHEVLHNVYDHMGRRGDRHPRLWNIANDFCVNGDLVEGNVGAMIDEFPICHDWQYRGKISEEIYDELYEKAKDQLDDLGVELVDVHLDPEGDNGAGSGDKNDDPTEGPVTMSESERKELKSEIKEAVLSSAKANGAGNVPRGVKKIINDLTNPKMAWHELLNGQIKSYIKDDFTFSRPNRKGIDEGVYLPGLDTQEEIDVTCMIDTSGSIYDEMLRDFLSEIKGIMLAFSNFKLNVACFDTECYEMKTFTPFNIDEIDEFELEGGGGTEFDCFFDKMKEDHHVPNKLVVFTDGYPWGSWGDDTYCDTIWVIHGGGYSDRFPEAPFGMNIKYESKTK